MAHKKAGWSAKNLRDSKPKYRWVKVFWWQKVNAWNIIIRQKGNKFECWKNVYMWRDFTILSNIFWIVSFKKKKIKRFDGRIYLKTVVEVFPFDNKLSSIEKKEPVKKEIVEKKVVAKKEPVKKEVVEKKVVAKKEPVKKEIVEKKVVAKKEPVKKEIVEKKVVAKKTVVKKNIDKKLK